MVHGPGAGSAVVAFFNPHAYNPVGTLRHVPKGGAITLSRALAAIPWLSSAGKIPHELGSLTSLTVLSLNNNKLSGKWTTIITKTRCYWYHQRDGGMRKDWLGFPLQG